ncbi:hypothetical protein F9K94_21665 [Brucella tritici]|uniref:Uncharacterized protein n=1 Tax=Brucella tritici TaxID=94626 RepID=A0A7V8B0X9_9HYPH|nr:hypothetical protein [Brucella tritici]KAB2655162.1 hypothetical protein F9K94_21665 [Brucella tritici]
MSDTAYYNSPYSQFGFPTVGTYAISILSCVVILLSILKAATLFGTDFNPSIFIYASVCFVGVIAGLAIAHIDNR